MSSYGVQEDLLKSSLRFNISDTQENKNPDERNVFKLVKAGKIVELASFLNKQDENSIYRLVNSRDHLNRDPIFYACFYDYRNLVLYLLMKGADTDTKDIEGNSIFHILCNWGHYRSLLMIKNWLYYHERVKLYFHLHRLKLEKKIKRSDIVQGDIKSPDQHLKSVKSNCEYFLMEAARLYETYLNGLIKVHNILCNEYRDPYNRNPIHYGAKSRYSNCAKCVKMSLVVGELSYYNEFEYVLNEIQNLEVRRANVIDLKQNIRIEQEIVKFLSPKLVKNLQKKHKKCQKDIHQLCLNLPDAQGYTPLHLATFSGCYELVDTFLRLGASKDAFDNHNNKQPMEYAANKSVMSLVKHINDSAFEGDQSKFEFLRDSGISVESRKGIFAETPLHSCIKSNTPQFRASQIRGQDAS